MVPSLRAIGKVKETLQCTFKNRRRFAETGCPITIIIIIIKVIIIMIIIITIMIKCKFCIKDFLVVRWFSTKQM